jgi:LPS-assembly protein
MPPLFTNLFTNSLLQRQMLTGLGLILAVSASNTYAGWDCATSATGEWLCQAGSADVSHAAETVFIPPSQPEAIAAPQTATNSTDAAILPAVTADTAEASSAAVTPAPITPAAITPAAKSADAYDLPTKVASLSDDWVPQAQLSAQQQGESYAEKATVQACCGSYVDPTAGSDKSEPANAPVSAHADTTETDMVNEVTELRGNVQVSQGYRYLRADKAVLKKNPQQVSLEGNVVLREPNLLLLSDKADVLVDENTAELSDVQYLMHKEHIHGSAQSLTRSETGVVSMIDARYSYCPVGSEQWELRSGSLTLDPNDSQGRARNVTLRVKDIPVFYTPYLQFPLGDQRMTGFLVPSFGTGEDGVEISTPYYLNLAPNYDLLLTPSYIGDRGTMLGANFRHMSEQTRSALNTNVLPDDSKANADEESDRWYWNAKQDGAGERWSSLVDMTTVSDDYYFQDISRGGFRTNSATQLRREAGFNYLPDNWRTGVTVKNYQTLGYTDVQPHEIMPSLFADGTYALESGPVVNLHHAVTRFDYRNVSADRLNKRPEVFYDVENAEKTLIAGDRYNLDYSVALPLRTAGAFLTPKVGVRHVTQQLDETTPNTPDASPSATVGVASLDSGLIFERDSQWFGKQYRQTLEPRMFYYYSDKQKQDDIYNFESDSLSFSYAQLFRDYRFAGEDYLDDANQVSTGVSSRLLSPTTGRELVRVGLGQTYYLSKRDIVLENDANVARYEQQRSHSSIVGDAAARINQYWDVRSETLWNDDTARRERQSLDLRYRDDERRLFNVGYQFLDRATTDNVVGNSVNRTIEQSYISAVYPLNNQWSLIGHWNHDMTNSRDLETIAGFQYDSCCWNARVVARRWVVNDELIDNIDAQETRNGIFFEIQLKTLGGFGDNLESRLSDSILGYDDIDRPLD